uniref:Uncharacterized protein n=1 Tax=Ascaris lumbricoides TaxID=6252 RepID=A0A0M3HZS2_ASCLU
MSGKSCHRMTCISITSFLCTNFPYAKAVGDQQKVTARLRKIGL